MNQKYDPAVMYNLSYGLYIVSCNDGKKDTGCIVNTPVQITSTINRIAITINKTNYTHEVVFKNRKLNICILSTEAPFSLFQQFGFQSGRNVNKFENIENFQSENGLRYLKQYCNGYISAEVEQYIEFDTHGMFICKATGGEVLSKVPSMTYSYYHTFVKPKAKKSSKSGYICKICGYVYEGEPLPEDFICPICKHGAEDFEKIDIEEIKYEKYRCSICGFVYDEANGLPENGIPAKTKFQDLPENFACPLCNAFKSLFEKI